MLNPRITSSRGSRLTERVFSITVIRWWLFHGDSCHVTPPRTLKGSSSRICSSSTSQRQQPTTLYLATLPNFLTPVSVTSNPTNLSTMSTAARRRLMRDFKVRHLKIGEFDSTIQMKPPKVAVISRKALLIQSYYSECKWTLPLGCPLLPSLIMS